MKELSRLSILNNNNHLKDVFTNGCYMEIGNIEYDNVCSLLRGELIKFEDLVNINILNNSKNRFNTNSNIDIVLSALYFENIYHKNKNRQIFITYGVANWITKNKKEVFAPIILIPVNIYIQEDDIYVKKIYSPIENKVLLNSLAEDGINIINTDNLNTIYALDKYILNFEKYKINIKLENMITFAYTSNKDLKIDHEKFEISKQNDALIIDKYYHPDIEDLFLVSALDKSQRVCLRMANDNVSYAISGKLGTGKTETLINIAVNALSNNKRVLYVSNIKETLTYVEERFNDFNIGYAISNLLKPFDELLIKKQYELPVKKDPVLNLKENLMKQYKIIDEYEMNINYRILNHSYISVLNDLAVFDVSKVKLIDIDNLSDLFKEEYKKVIYSLESISFLYTKLPSFKNSVWNNIPINNSVSFPNQVINLVFQMKSFYTQMRDESKALEKKYGFRPIAYYAALRNVINTFKNLMHDDVPSFWIADELKIYFEAKETFIALRNDYLEVKDFREFLLSKYNGLEELNIKTEIKNLYSYQFSKKEIEKIDFLFEKRSVLEPKINRGEIQRSIIFKTIAKIANFLEYEDDKSDEFVAEVARLSKFLSKNIYHTWWLDTKNETEYQYKIKRIKESCNRLSELDQLKKEFVSHFNKFAYKDIDHIIKIIDDVIELRKIARSDAKLAAVVRRSKISLHNLKQNVERLKYLRKNYNKYKNIYFEETGFNFQIDVDIIEDYENCFEYIDNIKPEYKDLMIKYLRSLYFKYSKNDIPVQTFNLLLKSMDDLDVLYDELGDYSFDTTHSSYFEKLENVSDTFKYLTKIYYSADTLKDTYKLTKKDIITSEDFFHVEADVDYINKLEKNLNSNEKYKNLFAGLFDGCQTNIEKLSNILQTLDNYVNCFATNKDASACLATKTYHKVIVQLSYLREVAEDANDVLKSYSKIFKGVVSKYYYESFESNLQILEKKLEVKEELAIYLTITKHFKKISKYNLPKLINSCVEQKDIKKTINNFKYTYVLMLYEMFQEKINLIDNDALVAALNNAYNLEKVLIEENVSALTKSYNKPLDTKKHIKNLDYSRFILRAFNKKVFLSDTEVLNNFLNIDDFDLVLIDDAYVLEAEAYYKALTAKQIIIAGEEPKKSFIANTLISRMRDKNIIHFDHCYHSVPKNLLSHSENLKYIIKDSLEANKGISVVKQRIEEKIVLLLQKDEDLKVNVYIDTLVKQKDFYEKLTIAFIKRGYSNNRIFKILTSNVNICDALDYYLLKGDYNVLFLDCYVNLESEHSVDLVIGMLMHVKTEAWIYDSGSNLSKDSLISKKLQNYINNVKLFDYNYDNEIVLKLAKALQLSGVEVIGRHDNLDILIRYNEKLSGIMILWPPDSLRFEVLNDFRYYVKEYEKKGIKVFMVTIDELLHNTTEKIKQIIGEL